MLAAAFAMAGCAKVNEPDYREHDYGYVQFKLYKEASYEGTKAESSKLEFLKDVAKVRVTLKYNDDLISQTLVVSAANDESAEYGLRSEKLKLLAGEYKVISYYLYDKVDNVVYEKNVSSDDVITVVPGGLAIHDLLADVDRKSVV